MQLELKQKKKNRWHVRLGETEWTRHTYAREDAALQLLGSVRRGAQVGALGVTDEGEYVQVVGDHLTTLSKRELTKAVSIARANSLKYGPTSRWAAPAPVCVAVPALVIVKRRRVYAPDDAGKAA